MKTLRWSIVLTAVAAMAPLIVRVARGQDEGAQPAPVMPQPNETSAMPNEVQQQQQEDDQQQPEAMPEQQQPEMMDATSQPATTQSVAEEDETSPQARAAASQRALVNEQNRQNRQNRQGRTYTRGTGTPQGRQPTNGNRSVATSRPASYGEVYGLLTERNIFLKDRSHPPTRPSTSNTSGPSRPVGERALVLTGVAAENDGYHAYFEDLNGGTVKRASVGDAVAKGKVLAIDIDTVQYESNGQERTIKIGQDLTGQDSQPAPSYVSSANSPTSLPAELVGKSLTDPNLTPEQKMKLRRAMEMQKQQ